MITSNDDGDKGRSFTSEKGRRTRLSLVSVNLEEGKKKEKERERMLTWFR